MPRLGRIVVTLDSDVLDFIEKRLIMSNFPFCSNIQHQSTETPVSIKEEPSSPKSPSPPKSSSKSKGKKATSAKKGKGKAASLANGNDAVRCETLTTLPKTFAEYVKHYRSVFHLYDPENLLTGQFSPSVLFSLCRSLFPLSLLMSTCFCMSPSLFLCLYGSHSRQN